MPVEAPVAPSVGSVTPPQPAEIHIGGATSAPSEPPKHTPQRDGLRERLQAKFTGKPETPPTKTQEKPATPLKQQEAAKPSDAKPQEAQKPGELQKAADAQKPAEAAKPAEAKSNEKMGPWQLKKLAEDRALAAETKYAKLLEAIGSEQEIVTRNERLTKAEARAKELEDEIRYVNYTKSSEFREKHQVPYERSITTAMRDLQGISFADKGGRQQQFDVNHLMELVSLPLPQARQLANELFPDFANDVMNHRNLVREKLDQQNTAIEEAKKTGADRDAQRMEARQQYMRETSTQANQWWEEYNKQVTEHPEHGEFIKQREGNDEWNSTLEKGFEMAKKAFSVNILDPRMKPEDRREAVKQQAALYNKAAAYGTMRMEIKSLRKQLSEAQSELKGYKDSTPGTGGQSAQTDVPQPAGGMDSLRSRLQSRFAQSR